MTEWRLFTGISLSEQMSLFDRQSSALSHRQVTAGSDVLSSPLQQPQTVSQGLFLDTAAALMSDNTGNSNVPHRGEAHNESSDTGDTSPSELSKIPVPTELDPHNDARAIVRLLQCQQCSLPLRSPTTLPCGNSICRACVPDLHKRENITYPVLPGRSEGFVCPFDECGLEHVLGDCSTDVVLSKVLDRVSMEVARVRPLTSNIPTLLEERPHSRSSNGNSLSQRTDYSNHGTSELSAQSRSRVLSGGRLLATYSMAELGELQYNAELNYLPIAALGDSYSHLDRALLEHLKETTRNELDCLVCFALMLDPLTTPCGHTFCRKCVARILDHSPVCPVCRRSLHIPPGAPPSYPSNKQLFRLLLTLCPEHITARAQQVEQEETAFRALDDGSTNPQIPLFVCTMAYPGMPTFLHVFEPRYRLMIRRAMESGGRRFGMVLHNARGTPQGALGRAPFMQYGTLLYIENIQLLPDGRSIIETRGLHRFRVLDHGVLDGYVIGRTGRIDDISLADEESLEATEVSSGRSDTGNPNAAQSPSSAPPLSSLSTIELLHIGTDFVARMRAAAAPWLAANYVAAYGPMPDDPALFPYWFASVLPIDEAEKYRLLPTHSVRDRLKITAGWVRRVEDMRW